MFENSLSKPRINPSRFTAFLRCQYLFYVKYILNLAKVGQLPPYLMLGSLFHEASAEFDRRYLPEGGYPRWGAAVEALMKGFRTAPTYSPADSEVIDVLRYDLDFFMRGSDSSGDRWYHGVDGELYETTVSPAGGYEQYRSRIAADMGWTVESLETRYAKDMGPAIIAPKPDGVIREPGTGLWVLERKTTQQDNKAFKNKFRVDPQTTLELLAVEDYFNEEVKGVYLLPTVYTRKRPANWRFPKLPTPLHKVEFGAPRPIPKSTIVRSSMEMNFEWFMEDVKEKTATGRWIQNNLSCMTGYSTCDLYDLCWGQTQLSDLVPRLEDDISEALARLEEKQ